MKLLKKKCPRCHKRRLKNILINGILTEWCFNERCTWDKPLVYEEDFSAQA